MIEYGLKTGRGAASRAQTEQARSPSIGIVADDLTSAADAASPFVKRGLSAYIGRGACPQVLADVISIDTGSRGFGCAAARTAAESATLRLHRAEFLFKTIDSTLRGNIKAEIAYAFRASGRQRLVIAPAFPAAGRTTLNGIQLVDGVPVADTVYGQDIVHPARTSRVSDLVDRVVADTFVLDAETQDDLDQQVAAFPDKREVLWVGSPGMARALAATFVPQTPFQERTFKAKSILVVVGSANPISKIQAKRLYSLRAVKCLVASQTRGSNSISVLTALVDEAEQELRSGNYEAALATGGETMDALLHRLGITEFSLDGEFEPGFPFGTTQLQNDVKSFIVAMKAGGFGGPNTLRDAAMRLLGSETIETEGRV